MLSEERRIKSALGSSKGGEAVVTGLSQPSKETDLTSGRGGAAMVVCDKRWKGYLYVWPRGNQILVSSGCFKRLGVIP